MCILPLAAKVFFLLQFHTKSKVRLVAALADLKFSVYDSYPHLPSSKLTHFPGNDFSCISQCHVALGFTVSHCQLDTSTASPTHRRWSWMAARLACILSHFWPIWEQTSLNTYSKVSSLHKSMLFQVLSDQKVLSSSGRAIRRWPMNFPIRRGLPARPEPDTLWTASTIADKRNGTITKFPLFQTLVTFQPGEVLPRIFFFFTKYR